MDFASLFYIINWCCVGFLALYGYNCYYYLYIFLKHRKQEVKKNQQFIDMFYTHVKGNDLPIVTIQLPIYNEKFVVKRLIESVIKLDYPKNKFQIQLLDDSTDDTRVIVSKLVEKYEKEGIWIEHICRKNRSEYKAGALSNGLKKAKGEYVAIFDADFIIPSHFLKYTVPFLMVDKCLGLVQTRWGFVNQNESYFTKAQAIGIDGHFIIEQSARCWGGLFLNFNGTGGIWRIKAIEDAGGWSGDTLTEDMDLSYRAQIKGWRTQFLYEVVCPSEIPDNINGFKTQQFRWAKGSIQTALKLLPRIFKDKKITMKKKIQSFLHMTHYMIHPVILIMLMLTTPFLLFNGVRFNNPIAWFFIGISFMGPSVMYFFSQREYSNSLKNLKAIPFLFCIGAGIAINNTFAVISAFFNKKGEFVRTPKSGTVDQNKVLIKNEISEKAPSSPKTFKDKKKFKKTSYHSNLKFSFFIEFGLSFYALFIIIFFLNDGNYFITPFMIIYYLGLTLLSFLSLRHFFVKSI